MPRKVRVFDSARTHDEAREKVCAVCINLWGTKAVRRVSEVEERLIQQHVLEGYTPINMFFPSGICVRCIHLLHQVKEGREVELKLPASYDCELPRHTRASEGEVCTCRWCDLARLNGPAFFLWQRKVKGLESGRWRGFVRIVMLESWRVPLTLVPLTLWMLWEISLKVCHKASKTRWLWKF